MGQNLPDLGSRLTVALQVHAIQCARAAIGQAPGSDHRAVDVAGEFRFLVEHAVVLDDAEPTSELAVAKAAVYVKRVLVYLDGIALLYYLNTDSVGFAVGKADQAALAILILGRAPAAGVRLHQGERLVIVIAHTG